jgi:hypothetical protein
MIFNHVLRRVSGKLSNKAVKQLTELYTSKPKVLADALEDYMTKKSPDKLLGILSSIESFASGTAVRKGLPAAIATTGAAIGDQ